MSVMKVHREPARVAETVQPNVRRYAQSTSCIYMVSRMVEPDDSIFAGVIVVELDDVVPRRHPDRPNLFVARTNSPITDRYEVLQRGRGPKRIQGHRIALRTDLSVEARSMTVEDSQKLSTATIRGLKSAGYTVNQDQRVWTVYVIELDPAATTDPGCGVVYVGETVRTPEERLQQHISKARSAGGNKLYSSAVAKHFVRLRMDLAPTERFFDRESSKRAEVEWADHLRSLGYVVKGGH